MEQLMSDDDQKIIKIKKIINMLLEGARGCEMYEEMEEININNNSFNGVTELKKRIFFICQILNKQICEIQNKL
jgi:hypothetical protein